MRVLPWQPSNIILQQYGTKYFSARRWPFAQLCTHTTTESTNQKEKESNNYSKSGKQAKKNKIGKAIIKHMHSIRKETVFRECLLLLLLLLVVFCVNATWIAAIQSIQNEPFQFLFSSIIMDSKSIIRRWVAIALTFCQMPLWCSLRSMAFVCVCKH